MNRRLFDRGHLFSHDIDIDQIASFIYEKRKMWFQLKSGEKIKIYYVENLDLILSRLYKYGVPVDLRFPQ